MIVNFLTRVFAAIEGILADGMQVRKTVQAIALVLAKQAYHPGLGGVLFPPSSSLVLPEFKATLVICPSVVVIPRVSEIDRSMLEATTRFRANMSCLRRKNVFGASSCFMNTGPRILLSSKWW